jgi:hypothetical protein
MSYNLVKESKDETRQKLEEALKIFRERGMAKHELEDIDDHVCANGAMNLAWTGLPQFPYVYGIEGNEFRGFRNCDIVTANGVMALKEVIEANYPDRIHSNDEKTRVVASFNNHEQTTQEEVEAVFEKAIASLY